MGRVLREIGALGADGRSPRCPLIEALDERLDPQPREYARTAGRARKREADHR